MKPFLFVIFIQVWSAGQPMSGSGTLYMFGNNGTVAPAHSVKRTRQVCADVLPAQTTVVIDLCHTWGVTPPKFCEDQKAPPCKTWKTEEYDVDDEEIVDDWAATRWVMDTTEQGSKHWKAVLIANSAALDRYLASTLLPRESKVFDVRAQKMLGVEQVEIKKKQTTTTEVFDHYAAKLIPERQTPGNDAHR